MATCIPDGNGAESESAAIQTFIDGGRLDCRCGVELTHEDGRWMHAAGQPADCDTPFPIIWDDSHSEPMTPRPDGGAPAVGARERSAGTDPPMASAAPVGATEIGLMEPATHLSNLRDFVDEVAGCCRDGEEAPDGRPFAWELDEAVDRLDALIGAARRIRDTWEPGLRQIDTMSIKDWAERLTCDEVESVVVAFGATGCGDTASRLLQSHIEGDCIDSQRHLVLGADSPQRGLQPTREGASGRTARAWRELEESLAAPVDNTGLIELLGHVGPVAGDGPPVGDSAGGLPCPPAPDDPGMGF